MFFKKFFVSALLLSMLTIPVESFASSDYRDVLESLQKQVLLLQKLVAELVQQRASGSYSSEAAALATAIERVATSAPVTVLAPNGGEQLVQGKQFTIKWKTTPAGVPQYVGLNLLQNNNHVLGLGNVLNTGVWTWMVPNTFSGNNFKIKIFGSGVDESDAPFSIVPPLHGRPSLTVGLGTEPPVMPLVAGAKDQLFATYDVTAPGEPIIVKNIRLHLKTPGISPSQASAFFSSFSLYNAKGMIAAGPKDSVNGFVYFSDPVIFKQGTETYTVKANVLSRAAPGTTISIMTNPAADWRNATGQISGQKIIPKSVKGILVSSPRTVGSLKFTMSVSPSSTPHTVIAGTNNADFTFYILDATNSSEDIRVISLLLKLTTAVPTQLNNCGLYDGSTALTAGVNSINPVPPPGGALTANYQFNLSVPFVVKKNSKSEVTLRCNVASSATSSATFAWGVDKETPGGQFVGALSGNKIASTIISSDGPIVTVSSAGTLQVLLDPSSPSSQLVLGGSVDVPVTTLRFTATGEPVTLKQISLRLDGSGNVNDLLKLSIWDGTAKVGEGIFSDLDPMVTNITLTSMVPIPKDSSKSLIIKTSFSKVDGVNAKAGDTVAINYNNGNPPATYGVGQNSGMQINSSTAEATAAGKFVVFKTIPVLQRMAIPSNVLTLGQNTLYRFSVAANAASDVGIGKISFRITATGGAIFSNPKLYVYADSSLSVLVGEILDLKAATGTIDTFEAYPFPLIEVAAGTTRFLELRTDVTAANTGSILTSALQGDAAFGGVKKLPGIDILSDNDFIWSGNTNTQSYPYDPDWANGYLIPGLPVSEMTAQVLSK